MRPPHNIPALVFGLTLALFSDAAAQTQIWTESEADSFRTGFGVDSTGVSITTEGGGAVLLAEASENFARGKSAVDNDTDPSSNPAALLDGNINTFWSSNTPNAVGLAITIDLEAVRTVERVNILGSTIDPPNKRVRGYLIEVSLEGNRWQTVAENNDNPDNDIFETFAAVTAQFIRVTITTADQVNWTFISEIEVFGSGYASQGTYLSEIRDFGPGQLINFGSATWEATLPQGTGLDMQFRADSLALEIQGIDVQDTIYLPHSNLVRGYERFTDMDRVTEYVETIDYMIDHEQGVLLRISSGRMVPGTQMAASYRVWSSWSSPSTQALGYLLTIPEPRRLLQYRANLATSSLESPALNSVSISYSLNPVAQVAVGSVSPTQVPNITESRLTYSIDLNSIGTDLGIDTVIVRAPSPSALKAVRFKGSALGYTNVSKEKSLIAALDQTLKPNGSGTLELDFVTTLFLSENPFPAALVSRVTGDNPQFVEEGAERWVVTTVGIPASPLLEVQVRPNPFSPNGDGRFDETTISFFVAKMAAPRRVVVVIYNLAGDRVREVRNQYGPADLYQLKWDGRNDNGDLVRPGVYLFQVRLEADTGTEVETHPVTVVY